MSFNYILKTLFPELPFFLAHHVCSPVILILKHEVPNKLIQERDI